MPSNRNPLGYSSQDFLAKLSGECEPLHKAKSQIVVTRPSPTGNRGGEHVNRLPGTHMLSGKTDGMQNVRWPSQGPDAP